MLQFSLHPTVIPFVVYLYAVYLNAVKAENALNAVFVAVKKDASVIERAYLLNLSCSSTVL